MNDDPWDEKEMREIGAKKTMGDRRRRKKAKKKMKPSHHITTQHNTTIVRCADKSYEYRWAIDEDAIEICHVSYRVWIKVTTLEYIIKNGWWWWQRKEKKRRQMVTITIQERMNEEDGELVTNNLNRPKY